MVTSVLSGIFVTMRITPPMELPAYAAENGPYSMSIWSMASGDVMPQRGAPIVLLLATSAEIGMSSIYTSVRALEFTPQVRVASTGWVSP
jgi:hypothetical protein